MAILLPNVKVIINIIAVILLLSTQDGTFAYKRQVMVVFYKENQRQLILLMLRFGR